MAGASGSWIDEYSPAAVAAMAQTLPVEQPFLDPVDIFAGNLAMVPRYGASALAGIVPDVVGSLVAEPVADEVPWLALPAAVGAGMLTGKVGNALAAASPGELGTIARNTLADQHGILGRYRGDQNALAGQWSSMADRQPRVEIDDSGAVLRDVILPQERIGGHAVESWRLGDVFDHPGLYEYDPTLADISMSFTKKNDAFAEYSPGLDHISLAERSSRAAAYPPGEQERMAQAKDEFLRYLRSPEYKGFEGRTDAALDAGEDEFNRVFAETGGDALEARRTALYEATKPTGQPEGYRLRGNVRDTLLHEIQHAVQEREGFARGGSPEDALVQKIAREQVQGDIPDILAFNPDANPADYLPAARLNAYQRLAGEIEARDVAARANLTPEQRLHTPPYSSEDIPLEEWIVNMTR